LTGSISQIDTALTCHETRQNGHASDVIQIRPLKAEESPLLPYSLYLLLLTCLEVTFFKSTPDEVFGTMLSNMKAGSAAISLKPAFRFLLTRHITYGDPVVLSVSPASVLDFLPNH
jgi:hypothetical protein